MNSNEEKRQKLLAAYPSPTWREKVKKMTDGQVVAIFLRLRRENKL